MNNDLEFFLEHGIELETFQALTKAAACIVDNGEPEKVYLVLFNQVAKKCKQNGIDHRPIFKSIIKELQARLDGPQTPQEFFAFYGDKDEW